jgi:hypothetical protein
MSISHLKVNQYMSCRSALSLLDNLLVVDFNLVLMAVIIGLYLAKANKVKILILNNIISYNVKLTRYKLCTQMY